MSTPKIYTLSLHDALPIFWSGDIWRLVLFLRKYRPDLSVKVIGTAPTGLGMVRGLDPDSRVLQEKYDAIVGEFLALDYSVLDADKPGMLALFPNDWERIKAILQ